MPTSGSAKPIEPPAPGAPFDFDVPGDVTINVWDANAETSYLVIPKRPPDTEHLSEDELASLVTRRGLIGTAPL
jgi:nitrile hydratase